MVHTSRRLLIRHPDSIILANSVAHRLLSALADTQAARGEASIVLTGGTIGTTVLKTLAEAPEKNIVDWSKVNFWWSDERFVPKNSPDRNELQAQEACLSYLPVNPQRIHPIPSTDDFSTVEEASEYYWQQLLATEATTYGNKKTSELFSRLPKFDILLLGMGPDGHIASLFPNKSGIASTNKLTIPVTDSPKPPPERISLSLPVINTATEVWFIVSGRDKAEATAHALSDKTNIISCPASGVSGQQKTLWLVDEEAASLLPSSKI